MPRLKIYLAFDDAYSAMKYYEKTFGAVITRHIPVTKDVKEEFELEVDVNPYSTFDGEFTINGIFFGCSDNFDDVKNYNNSFNTVLEYSNEEGELFDEIVNKVHNSDGVINYESLDKTKSFRILCFTDKYGINWSFTINN